MREQRPSDQYNELVTTSMCVLDKLSCANTKHREVPVVTRNRNHLSQERELILKIVVYSDYCVILL